MLRLRRMATTFWSARPIITSAGSYIYTDGQAYLFDAATGNLLHTFNPPDGTSNDWDKFGYTVALDGNRVLIGDPNRNVGGDDYVGRAYLYDAITGDLVRTIDDPAPAYNGRFASAVAIDGNHILIGNHQHAVPDGDGGTETVGEAYLIDATTGDLLHTLNAPANTPNYAFGVSVAIEGDQILISSLIEGSGNEVHLFDTTSGSPLHVFTNPTQPITDGGFGVSMAIDGDRFLIGASHDPAQGDNVGQAYLFDATSYDLIHSFADPTPTSLDYFGRVVALEG